MPFTIEPISEEEAQGTGGLWERAFYKFYVVDAEETESKSGNDMVVATLQFKDGSRSKEIKDYLVFLKKTQWKIRSFYESLGLVKLYDSGIIDASKLIGASGRAELIKEEYLKEDGTKGQSNKIGKYAKSGSEDGYISDVPSPTMAEVKAMDEEDDDIPF